eukprot:133742_1
MSSKSGYRVVVRENDKGGAEKLIYEKYLLKSPRDNQIVIQVKACGINFIDTYHRSGLYPGVTKLGLEGAGIVVAVGKNARNVYTIGDRVCWDSTIGSYSTHLITSIKNPNIIKIPQILFDTMNNDLSVYKYAASILSQGLTAHYLCRDLYKVSSNDTVLIHAGAGGTGGLLIQMCKNICGAKCVITTVSNEKKKHIAFDNGADYVIMYKQTNFYDKVMEITNKQKCDVVFDGVGKRTANNSLKCCKVRGMMVYFGNASGAVDPVDPLILCRQGSVFMTRPTLKDYCRTKQEKQMRVDDIFKWIAQKKLKIRIGSEFALKDVRKAHEALESRRTMGKIVLIPSSSTVASKL